MREYNYLFVSDFHVAMGQPDPNHPAYYPREDFFFDEAFRRFLEWADNNREGGKKWELVFNGDCFDFWPLDARLMKEITKESVESLSALPKLCSKLSKNYALHNGDQYRNKTHEESELSVRKLASIHFGHPTFFEALGGWIAQGHRVVMMRGNHDLELYWPDVQHSFKELIHKDYSEIIKEKGGSPLDLESDEFSENIDFSRPWFYHQPSLFYAEHGSQHEPANSTPNFLNPVRPNPPEQENPPQKLNPPFGSLIVQYLLSPLEDKFPELENRGSYIRFIFKLVLHEPEKIVRTLLLSIFSFFRAARKLWREAKYASQKPENFDEYEKNAQLSEGMGSKLYDIGAKPLLSHWLAAIVLLWGWGVWLIAFLAVGLAIFLLWFYFGPFLTQLNEEIAFWANWASGESNIVALSPTSAQRITSNSRFVTWFASLFALVKVYIPIFNLLAKLPGWFVTMVKSLAKCVAELKITNWLLKLFGKSALSGIELFDTDNYLFNASKKIHAIFVENENNDQPIPKYYIFGHDHHPDSRDISDGVYYLNTGAWLPIFHEETARLRTGGKDVEFTFLKIWAEGDEHDHELLRWNDDAERPELQIVPYKNGKSTPTPILQAILAGFVVGAFVGVYVEQLIISMLIFGLVGFLIGFIRNRLAALADRKADVETAAEE